MKVLEHICVNDTREDNIGTDSIRSTRSTRRESGLHNTELLYRRKDRAWVVSKISQHSESRATTSTPTRLVVPTAEKYDAGGGDNIIIWQIVHQLRKNIGGLTV